jgi:hypothetical protein
LFVPKEFADFVYNEERTGTDWHIELGRAQTDGLKRLMNAMFERVVLVDSLNAGPQMGADVRAILEPSVEEYAFVTPRDAGSPFFAVSIKYRINVYTPDGRLADSWGFTGYGTAPSQGITSDLPLTQATALALRDAGAKLAVEFREQAIVRGLLPESAVPDTPIAPPGAPPAASGTPAATPSPTPPADATDTPAEPTPQDAPVDDQSQPSSPPPAEPSENEKRPEPPVPESLAQQRSGITPLPFAA